VRGTPRALAGSHSAPGWRLHRIVREAAGWRVETAYRLLDPATGIFREHGHGTWRLAGLGGS